MTVKEIKIEMENFRDFYGGDLLNSDGIKTSKTRKDLSNIIERHRSHMESMAIDADVHLDNFKRKIGLDVI